MSSSACLSIAICKSVHRARNRYSVFSLCATFAFCGWCYELHYFIAVVIVNRIDSLLRMDDYFVAYLLFVCLFVCCTVS